MIISATCYSSSLRFYLTGLLHTMNTFDGLILEIETMTVATAQTDDDFFLPFLLNLPGEVRIDKDLPTHGDKIGLSFLKNFFCEICRFDLSHCNDRTLHLLFDVLHDVDVDPIGHVVAWHRTMGTVKIFSGLIAFLPPSSC